MSTPMYKETYDVDNKSLNVYNSANHTYQVPHTGAFSKSVAERLDKEVWVTDYYDQMTHDGDWRIPIKNAIAAGGLVRFPPGVFLVSRASDTFLGIELVNNTFLVGAGQGATVIMAKGEAGNIHLVGTRGDNVVSNIGIRDLTLDHNGLHINATAGCHAVRLKGVDGCYIRGVTVKNSDQHGILTEGISSDTAPINENIFISDVYLENIGVGGRHGGDGLRLFLGMKNVVVNNIIGYGIEYHGIHVAYGAATVSNVILYNVGNVAISAESDGVVMSNIHVEWEADHLICDLLANRPPAGTFGRHFRASDVSSDNDVTGVYRWYYDNGFAWQTAKSNPSGLWAITRANFPPGGKSLYSNIKMVMNITENTTYNWVGSDGIRLDTQYNSADNIYVFGRFRFGAYITGSDNNLSKIIIEGCREDGIRIFGGASNTVDSWRVVTANTSNTGSRAVRLKGCVNNKIINGFSLDPSIDIAIAEEDTGTNNSIITGNDVRPPGSSTKISTIGADSVVRGNLGYKTEAKGIATIPSGSTSVSVTHGLNRTPSNGSIMVTPTNNPTNNPGHFWVSGITSTVFVINCQNNPGSSGAGFSWNAEVL